MPTDTSESTSGTQPNVLLSVVAGSDGAAAGAEVRFASGRRWAFASDGTAPSPVEAVLASLAACQVITYHYWAARLGIALERCSVRAEGIFDPRGFQGDPAALSIGYQSVQLVVTIGGPEAPERYEELGDSVDRHCPVHSSLTAATPIERQLCLEQVAPLGGH